jgi:hypothetical protein
MGINKNKENNGKKWYEGWRWKKLEREKRWKEEGNWIGIKVIICEKCEINCGSEKKK